MSSAFFEFNVATTGLFVAKSGLEVVSHNMANSTSEGYSRQIANQRATTPQNGTNGVGMIGTGAEVYSVTRVRDFYLDKKYWSQSCTLGEYSTKSDQLNLVETIFNENSDSGITNIMNSFFNQLSNLTFDAGDDTYRTSVVTYTDNLVSNLSAVSRSLQNQQSDINDDIYATVQKINDLGHQIATLDKQIYYYELDGQNANDLRDQRGTLIDELSNYANVEVKAQSAKSGNADEDKYVVLINGEEFINHDYVRELSCVKREQKLDEDDVAGLYDVTWPNGDKINLNGLSGQLKGLIDLRDGNVGLNGSVNYKGIPYYIDKLSNFVRTFAQAVNEGKNADGSEIEGMTAYTEGYNSYGEAGNLLFTYTKEDGTQETELPIDYSNMTVFNFGVSDELKNDPKLLAASSSPSTDDESNNEVILGMVSLKDNTSLFKEGSLGDYVVSISTSLGIDAKQAKNFKEYYTDVATAVDNQRLQVSGVSLNEEIANLVRYQQLYRASCQLINVIDNIYATTINNMGVG